MARQSDKDISNAAKQLSQRGAQKGGRARASVLTSDERKAIARKAAAARWAKDEPERDDEHEVVEGEMVHDTSSPIPFSLFRGTLEISDLQIECHVLNDHRRVFTQREVVRIVSGGVVGGNLGRYLRANPLYEEGLLDGRKIQFRIPGTTNVGRVANGYEATLLVEICDLYLRARNDELLKPNQQHLARMAETVMRACAKVGIIALVDEATGYQQVREKQALQLKLQAFIAEDMQEWAKMFPDEFWYELARLEGVRYSARSRPLRWGKYVMAFVYDAVDKDVGQQLREINPNPQHGRNHHQWLKDFGREKVNNQIQQIIAIMKLCDDMGDFKKKFARVFTKMPYRQLEFDFLDS